MLRKKLLKWLDYWFFTCLFPLLLGGWKSICEPGGLASLLARPSLLGAILLLTSLWGLLDTIRTFKYPRIESKPRQPTAPKLKDTLGFSAILVVFLAAVTWLHGIPRDWPLLCVCAALLPFVVAGRAAAYWRARE